jgi:poly-gamma-glutamate synthesis protein (capsule biosynthesis protein)
VSLSDGRIETIPLKLEYTHTRLADGEDAEWIRRRFESACARLAGQGAANAH